MPSYFVRSGIGVTIPYYLTCRFVLILYHYCISRQKNWQPPKREDMLLFGYSVLSKIVFWLCCYVTYGKVVQIYIMLAMVMEPHCPIRKCVDKRRKNIYNPLYCPGVNPFIFLKIWQKYLSSVYPTLYATSYVFNRTSFNSSQAFSILTFCI